MENTTTMEQPEINLDSAENKVNEPIKVSKEVSDTDNLETGSTYGKFKDATSLLEAYNNLQREFTRKSQKLAEILKDQEDSTNVENSHIKHNLESPQVQTSSISPKYKQANWRIEVSKFFETNPEAKKYSKEISNILINDKDLLNNSNCLEYAYALARKQTYIEPAKLLDDPNYIDSLATNKKLKDLIIKNYLTSLSNGSSNPRFITGEPKNLSPTPPKDKPKNLKEASSILKKLLQS